MSDRQFELEVVRRLRDLGVERPTPGVPGRIPLKGVPLQARVVERRIVAETTGARQRLLNAVEPARRVANVRSAASLGMPCLGLLPCGLRPLCCKEKSDWVPPVINFDSAPQRIPQATIHLNPFNAYIEGRTTSDLWNQSTEGQKHTQRECHCRGGKNTDSSSAVSGSADLSTSGSRDMVMAQLGHGFDVSEAFQGVRPQAAVQADFSYMKTGILDVLWDVINILITGSASFDTTLDVAASWQWLGQPQSKSYSVSHSLRLPVDQVNYAW